MQDLKTTIFAIVLSIVLTNCGSNDKSNNSTSSNNIFGIKGEEIVLHTGPGQNFDKVVNQKTTDMIHETVYATVDNSVKVREEETKDGWSKIVVVDPDWLSESHQGWIESKYIIKTEEQAAETIVPRKNKIFNEVPQVQSKLSSVGIGELRKWSNDSYSWTSSTPYHSFGSISSDNGMQNNLAYYLESKSGTFIETLKLVLNINNSSEKSKALSLLDKTTQKTFLSLKLKKPNGLSAAIRSGNNFTSDNSEFKVSFMLDQSKIETWELTIEAK